MLAATGVVGLVLGWRYAFERFDSAVIPKERLLIVGTEPGAVALARELHERKEVGMQVVGFIDNGAERTRESFTDSGAAAGAIAGIPVVGTTNDIPAVVENYDVDRIVVSLIDARGKLPVESLLDLRLQGIHFDHLASVYEEHTGKIPVENLRPSWLIFSDGFRKSSKLLFAKRAVDVVAGAVGLVVLSPLMALVAAGVWLTSKGPVLYHQERVGQDGRPFTLHKFRSMRDDAEAASGAVWAAQSDSRLTPIGGILRGTRLDEVPQLWNVLVGEMSLVGPRPERPEFVGPLIEKNPLLYRQRHVLKPGITGWAQVSYHYGASVDGSMEKLKYDLFYIKNLSVALDLFIILKTVKTVVMQRGAR